MSSEIPASVFFARTRSQDPFARSQIPEQNLYRGELPNRMSVFGFTSSLPLSPPPPKYQNPSTRALPPPYKAPLDIQQSPLSSHLIPPPPSYQPQPEEEGDRRPWMAEPPKYSRQVEREATRESIAKDRLEETNSDVHLEGPNSGRGARAMHKREENEERDKGRDWCCGCFWVGPHPLYWPAYIF